MARRSLEPIVWLMFGAGGMLSALIVPILLVLLGLAFPLGWLDPPSHQQLMSMVSHPLVRAGIFVFCMFALVHGAHRLRFTLYDGLQIKHLNELIALLCYGGAVTGTVIAGYLLWNLA